jgi:multicomponent Na+:H+ antiporter subunit F
MFVAATVAILATMALGLLRALLGPTVFDRILAVNTIATKTTLLIAVLGFLTGRPDFLDIALVYALINFIGTIAILKFFKYGEFSGDGLDANTEQYAQPLPWWVPPELSKSRHDNSGSQD